ncbi:UNVERIFIED_CONTAM: hypothetical protein PYX00_007099 [Menopon gallinae]|uniref:Uncharacterized protein n=1 Tax=Menopon gallinae TaxID=328185 RepID=A0AAW2HHI4_9NEOP
MLSVKCLKYNLALISDLTFVTKEGKQLWETLSEKVNLPQYGSCWKEAISDLRVGCKFLSEDIQSDLALRFTDCFLQMSGHEPIICHGEKEVCLRNLSDRAFNAYTEFYTHTQSICYFLQSQVWHEEAQKTIDKLSDTSALVTAQLEEAGHIQKDILNQQKESVLLQNFLLDNGKTIASALESSEEKISKIMRDFQDSAVEHKKLLFELFEKLTLLRSWVMVEMSWINSLLFYMSAMIIGYLFTSLPSTRNARGYIQNIVYWIWFIRKFFVVFSIIILIYCAAVYCDYNIVNHKLLVEIKNQNKKLLSIFETNNVREGLSSPTFIKGDDCILLTHSVGRSNIPTNYTISPVMGYSNKNQKSKKSFRDVDDIDNVSIMTEKSEASVVSAKKSTPYNLRARKEQV